MQLSDITAIYQYNYESKGFNGTHTSDPSTTVSPTRIFARIPLTDTVSDLISFEDENDNFSITLSAQQLTTAVFTLTDGQNRPLPWVGLDGVTFNLVVKYQVLEPFTPSPGAPGSETQYSVVKYQSQVPDLSLDFVPKRR